MELNQLKDPEQREGLFQEIDDRGWAVVSNVYNSIQIDEINAAYQASLPVYNRIHESKGMAKEVQNATHHTAVVCPKLLGLIDPNPLHETIEAYFSGRYILYTLGVSSTMPNNDYVYTQNIHRDIRSFTGSMRLQLNTIVLFTDSTEENGATFMLEGSHKFDEKPSQQVFDQSATRAVGKAGDVIIFDSNLWHSAGVNQTTMPRTICTPIYCRPFMKQSFDYPRAFGFDYQHQISEELKQVLGYNALIPSSLEEFYQPTEKRFYKSDQG